MSVIKNASCSILYGDSLRISFSVEESVGSVSGGLYFDGVLWNSVSSDNSYSYDEWRGYNVETHVEIIINDSIDGQTSVDLGYFVTNAQARTLSSPSNNAVVTTTTPTFSWQNPSSYWRLVVYISLTNGTPVTSSGYLYSGTSWTPSSPLNSGTIYNWQVGVQNNNGVETLSVQWQFTVQLAGGGYHMII